MPSAVSNYDGSNRTGWGWGGLGLLPVRRGFQNTYFTGQGGVLTQCWHRAKRPQTSDRDRQSSVCQSWGPPQSLSRQDKSFHGLTCEQPLRTVHHIQSRPSQGFQAEQLLNRKSPDGSLHGHSLAEAGLWPARHSHTQVPGDLTKPPDGVVVKVQGP